MNRPKITKQTLKELRGEIFLKQSEQERLEGGKKGSVVILQQEEQNPEIVQANENDM